MSKYTLHFKYQAVLRYLHIRSQQRTADHYGISRTRLRRWIHAYQEGGIGALEHPQSKTMTDHRQGRPDPEPTKLSSSKPTGGIKDATDKGALPPHWVGTAKKWRG